MAYTDAFKHWQSKGQADAFRAGHKDAARGTVDARRALADAAYAHGVQLAFQD